MTKTWDVEVTSTDDTGNPRNRSYVIEADDKDAAEQTAARNYEREEFGADNQNPGDAQVTATERQETTEN